MSQVLIHQYLAELDRLKRISGTHREGVVSEAFKDLLKGWGKQHDLVFVPQYRLDSATKDIRTIDGALLHELRVPFGYLEADYAKDDLDEEIAFKFKRGYGTNANSVAAQGRVLSVEPPKCESLDFSYRHFNAEAAFCIRRCHSR